MKKKKTSGKSKGFVKKSKPSTDKDTNLLDQQNMELQMSSPNSLKEETTAGSFEEQYFAIWAYKFREQKLVDAWPKLESAAEKHGVCLTLNRVKLYIAISTTPRTKDLDIFNMTKEFIQLLAKTSVSPSMGNTIIVVRRSLLVAKLIRGYTEECSVHNMKPSSLLKKVKAVYDTGLVQRELEALSI